MTLTVTRRVCVDTHWDIEGQVWLATSADVPGLVVEGDNLAGWSERSG